MSELRKRIETERSSPEWRKSFSEDLKKDVVAAALKCAVKSQAARQLGVSQSNLTLWMEIYSQAVAAPRKLLVVNDSELQAAQQQEVHVAFVEAALPNGVVLRNFPLTQAALDLLRGVR
jgi:transposase-like protein